MALLLAKIASISRAFTYFFLDRFNVCPYHAASISLGENRMSLSGFCFS
jgi:hypothetical protein